MQCPIAQGCCCLLSPKFIFLAIAGIGLVLGALSAFWPSRSIGFYQWLMERFNWKVMPIDSVRELRNTRVLGAVLILFSLAIPVILFFNQ